MIRLNPLAHSPARKSFPTRGHGGRPPLLRASLLSLLLLFPLFSCSGLPAAPRPLKITRIVEAVPFYPQEEYQCGPASLAGVLDYYGLRDSPEKIASQIFSRKAGGTLDMDLVFYAQRRGMKALQYRGSLEDLKRNIDSGRPLIVLVDGGLWVYQQNHFMVVVGYGEEGIIANSGREQHQFFPYGRFLQTWEKTKFWTLRITPP